MKGRYRLVTSLLVRMSPSYHAARATAWESYTSLHLGKQVSHMESASASYDSVNMQLEGLYSMNVNQMEVSILIVLTHFLMGLSQHNEAVQKSVRRKTRRTSLLGKTRLTKHMQVPLGAGTANPRTRANPTTPASALHGSSWNFVLFMLKHHATTATATINMQRLSNRVFSDFSNRIMGCVIEIHAQGVEETLLSPLRAVSLTLSLTGGALSGTLGPMP